MTYLIFARSIFLTSTFSFAMPLMLIGAMLVGLSILEVVPLLESLSQAASLAICDFLAAFGQGNVGQGVMAIGLTCALVGALFDAYAFCHRQKRA